MTKPPKVDFRKLLEPRNRGILLDIVVFVVNLVLMTILTRLSRNLVDEAERDNLAKAAVGLFFAGLFFLQPLGPVFKRWSFHQQHKFDTDSPAGCLLAGLMFFYLIMMLLISSTATIILTEVFFEPGSPEFEVGPILILGGLAWSIVNVVLIYRYFVRPKKPPRSRFLTTPAAAILGDIFMFINVICLQVLWNSLTAATSFWSQLTSTPLGRPGSFTDILGRFIVIGTLALLVYFPGRIFYLVEDRRRKIIWLTMLLANLPLLLRAVFAPPT
jgi:hypothetical protein